MGLYQDLAGWTIFGVSVQGLAQAIRQKPFSHKPMGYMYSAVAFLGVGLVADSIRHKQAEFLDRRLAMLLQQRKDRGIEFQRSTL